MALLVEERKAVAVEEQKNDRAGQGLRQDQLSALVETLHSLSSENSFCEAHHIAFLASHYPSPSNQVQRIADTARQNCTKIGDSSTFLHRPRFCLSGIVEAIEAASEDCSSDQRV